MKLLINKNRSKFDNSKLNMVYAKYDKYDNG